MQKMTAPQTILTIYTAKIIPLSSVIQVHRDISRQVFTMFACVLYAFWASEDALVRLSTMASKIYN